ncbi:hypothetical protein LSAT2_007888 [Lamellibrachia satsuma]|nr:hypothetical protein LSAT2_007888 [Lamellibrachia satsuma]
MSLDRIRSRTSAVSPGTIVSEPSRSLYSAIVRSPIYTRVTDAMSRSGSFRSRTLSTSTNTSHRTPSHAPSDDYEANSPSPVTWNARGTALCSAPAVSVSNIGFPQKRHRIRFLLDSSVESESPSITSQTSLKKAGFKTIRMPIIRNTGYFSRDVNHRRKSYATYLRDPILDRFSKMISRRESRDRDLSMSPEDDDDNNQRTNSRGIPPVE